MVYIENTENQNHILNDWKSAGRDFAIIVGACLLYRARIFSKASDRARKRLRDRCSLDITTLDVSYRPFGELRVRKMTMEIERLKVDISECRLRFRWRPFDFLTGRWSRIRIWGSLAKARFHHCVLAPAPIEVKEMQWRLAGIPKDRNTDFDLLVGGFLGELGFSGSIQRKKQSPEKDRNKGEGLRIAFQCLPFEPVQFLRSFPFSVCGQLRDLCSEGRLSFEGLFTLQPGNQPDHSWHARLLRDNFAVRRWGTMDLSYLNGPFIHTIRKDGLDVKRVRLAEGADDFVALENISPLFICTILLTEDPRFYSHKGFDEKLFGYAIRKNIHDGRISRGGSTITMQLARNLFLSHDRTIYRKLEEMLLAWLMEEMYVLTKDRMLEIYLNIIEFGPNLYGLRPASTYYFGKEPAALTLTESLVLSYIVPRPRHFADALAAGSEKLVDGLRRHVSRFGRLLMKRSAITAEEYRLRQDRIHFACHPMVIHLPR